MSCGVFAQPTRYQKWPVSFGVNTTVTTEQVLLPQLPAHRNFVQRLRHWSSHRPDKDAYRYLVDGEDDVVSLTYHQFDLRARAVAAELQRRGLTGERVLLLYPPGLDCVVALFGCFYAGAIAVPAYPPRRNRNMNRIQAISDDAGAKAALSVEDVTKRVERYLEEAPNLRNLQWFSTDQISDAMAERWEVCEPADDSLAILQYTSGSTGTPKGVMLTHSNIMHNCSVITYAFEAGASDFGMSWLPTYHDMGLVGGVLNPMFCGRPTVLMSPMAFVQKPYRWLRGITKYRVTVSGGPNFAYDMCTKKVTPEQLKTLDLSSWALAFNGAEPVRADTLDEFCRKFEPCGFRREAFYPCYGMAESTLLVTGGRRNRVPVVHTIDRQRLGERKVVEVSPDHELARSLIGCGKVLPQEHVIIVDPDQGVRLPDGRVGEIWLASGSVACGYLNKPEQTKETFQASLSSGDAGDTATYLRSGDMGFFKDGELFVTGRLKDLIIIRGVNRYPQDIEMTVERSDERLRTGACAAISVDLAGGERLIVVSEVERVPKKDWSDVVSAIRRNVTAEHDLPPDGIVLVRAGSMPKTSSGKIQRHACRDGFINGSLMVVACYYAWENSDDENGPAATGATTYRSSPGSTCVTDQNAPQATQLTPSGNPSSRSRHDQTCQS